MDCEFLADTAMTITALPIIAAIAANAHLAFLYGEKSFSHIISLQAYENIVLGI